MKEMSSTAKKRIYTGIMRAIWKEIQNTRIETEDEFEAVEEGIKEVIEDIWTQDPWMTFLPLNIDLKED